MKKFLKVTLIVALVLLGIFLLDLGLKLIFNAPINTCRKAYEKLQQTDAHIVYYENDQKKKGEIAEIPINWTSVEREFKVETDKNARTITFYSFEGSGITCEAKRYFTYSKHIFAFDPEGNLSVYCFMLYDGVTYEMRSKKTYKVCCFDKENCTAE